jgi:hypothetical protein
MKVRLRASSGNKTEEGITKDAWSRATRYVPNRRRGKGAVRNAHTAFAWNMDEV